MFQKGKHMDSEALKQWFETVKTTLENAYISHKEPWRQSGMSGPEERWVTLRKPVAECIDRPGTFLDIGCANGYLLECCLRWTAERGIPIDPYGLDISERLLELARQRLPAFADHFYVGNSFYWQPPGLSPHRFDFVRTELVYVPGEYERAYVERLLKEVVAPGGRLLVANYGEDRSDAEKTLLPGSHPTRYLLERLEELRLKPVDYKDGFDPIKNRHVRVAVLTEESL